MGNSSKRDAKKAKVRQRQAEALELRKAGATYEAIAKRLGYTDRSNARKDIQAALKEIVVDKVDEYRSVQHLRLEDLVRSIWLTAKKGDLGAIQTIIRLSERHAALMGLDLPRQKEIKIIDEAGGATPSKAAALMREQFGSTTPDAEGQSKAAGAIAEAFDEEGDDAGDEDDEAEGHPGGFEPDGGSAEE